MAMFALKLSFSQEKLYSRFHCFKCFIRSKFCETLKFTDLGESATLIQPELFQFYARVFTYL